MGEYHLVLVERTRLFVGHRTPSRQRLRPKPHRAITGQLRVHEERWGRAQRLVRPAQAEAEAMTDGPPPDEVTILTQALRAAECAWRDLLAEQLSFPQRIRQAIRAGHRAQLVSLQQRQDELPQHIARAQVTVLQLQIRLLEIEHRVVTDRQQQLQSEVAEAWEAYQLSCKQWEEAVQVQAAVDSRLQSIEQRLSRLKRQRERACNEGSGG